jgi:hypothetical protein
MTPQIPFDIHNLQYRIVVILPSLGKRGLDNLEEIEYNFLNGTVPIIPKVGDHWVDIRTEKSHAITKILYSILYSEDIAIQSIGLIMSEIGEE